MKFIWVLNRKPEENNRWLSYREMGYELAEYCKEMGFTHVEVCLSWSTLSVLLGVIRV